MLKHKDGGAHLSQTRLQMHSSIQSVKSWPQTRSGYALRMRLWQQDSREIGVIAGQFLPAICQTEVADLQITNLKDQGVTVRRVKTNAVSSPRTMTVLPLAYAILSLFELILVDSPRVVVGLHGNKASFLYDMLISSSVELPEYSL